ncbi:hypothetical protein D1155_14130 [Anaerotruncus sp. 80]|uniref:Zn-finger containing protein n=1 Tax=Anaerotruncus colihominis TaxID=169435 RepID=A0A845QN08_9FIRM|nr:MULTISPECIES: hypothetical protein [Anaerotruncus]NBH62784.1 hypothetical protein [Anaerotruncus colihominis]NCF03438.1 hypothetical protein [Anaerotruncus sp. 80]
MNGFRYRIYQFMQGRRGVDQYGRFLLIVAMTFLIVSMFTLENLFYYLGLMIFIYAYYRIFSRNLYKRERENTWYLTQKFRLTKGKSFRQKQYEWRYYAYFKCPGCGQKMRAPRGKGTIKIKCHSCNTEFQKKV